MRDVLQDRVDVRVLGRNRIEDGSRRAWSVGNVSKCEDDLVLRVRHRRDDGLLEVVGVFDPRSGLRGEGRPRVDAHALPARELDSAQHQHLRSGRRHLEHLLVRHLVELAGVGDDPRIGGEDTGDVGVDLAGGTEGSSQRNCGQIGAAPSERRHVHRVAREPLIAGDEDDLPQVEGFDHAHGCDLADLRFRVNGVGDDPGLRAGERDGLVPEIVHRHRDECAGDALSGREEHVELAWMRLGRDLVRERQEAVGRVARRGDRRHDA